MTYDWQAGAVLLLAVYLMTHFGYIWAFKIPAFQRMREINRERDAVKMEDERYPATVKASIRVGMATNIAFFFVLAPFVVTLESKPFWQYLLEIVFILLVFDFFYYLAHRFLLHGTAYFVRVHSVHPQARKPTMIDAFLVHPVETFIGQGLFIGSAIVLGALFGPFHVGSVAVAYVAYVQLNLLNHNHVELPFFPFKTIDWITTKHAIHHINMSKGNYATITMIYDWAFGTLD